MLILAFKLNQRFDCERFDCPFTLVCSVKKCLTRNIVSKRVLYAQSSGFYTLSVLWQVPDGVRAGREDACEAAHLHDHAPHAPVRRHSGDRNRPRALPCKDNLIAVAVSVST